MPFRGSAGFHKDRHRNAELIKKERLTNKYKEGNLPTEAIPALKVYYDEVENYVGCTLADRQSELDQRTRSPAIGLERRFMELKYIEM